MTENPGQEQRNRRISSPEDESTDGTSAESPISPAANRYPDILSGAFFLAQEGKLRLLNPKAASIAGYSSEEIESKPFIEFIHPDDRELVGERHFRRIEGEGVSPRYSFRVIHRDGHLVWVELNSTKIEWAGKPATLNFLTDITERVRIENALRESEEKFRTLVEQSPLGISLIRRDGRYAYVNPRFREIFGYAIEDIPTGAEWFRKAFPDENERKIALAAWSEDRQRTGRGQSRPRVYEVNCKDGTRKVIHFRAVTLENLDQFVIYEDISERRRLEDQLRQSQKMEAIGTLASGIAHEFNNVLAIIMGNTELALMEMPEWNPVRSYLDQIQSASLRARDLVKHILSFARKAPACRKPVQIALVVREAMKLMRSTIPAGIEIRLDITCESDIVSADPTEIQQIVMNLCTNAAHAMRRSEGILTVGLAAVTLDRKAASRYEGLDPGNFVRLTVKDTGQGIAPELIDRIFEPFFTTKDVGQGTGMGLAVVYGILKKYAGAITVQSEPGKGTLVEVLFPRLEKKKTAQSEEPEIPPRGSERILFIDDESSIVELAGLMLKRQGYEVTAVLNSREALDLFKKKPEAFDLVISDLAMPLMAGDRLVQEMLKIRPGVPLILCTGNSDRMNERAARAIGVKAFVLKPIMAKEMLKTVRKVLDGASG